MLMGQWLHSLSLRHILAHVTCVCNVRKVKMYGMRVNHGALSSSSETWGAAHLGTCLRI